MGGPNTYYKQQGGMDGKGTEGRISDERMVAERRGIPQVLIL